MKKLTQSFVAGALALALLSPVSGSALYFSFTQGTGNQSDQEVGTVDIDNPSGMPSANNVTAPAISASMLYFSPTGSALFECTVNTNVSSGQYWVGDFKDWGGNGADVYAYIN